MSKYIVYTHGGYSVSHNIGAASYLILEDGKVVKVDGRELHHATGNLAQMLAIKDAIGALPDGADAVVRTSAQHAIGVLSLGWNAKAHTDTIAAIIKDIQFRLGYITFEWVGRNEGNEHLAMCAEMNNDIVGFDLRADLEDFLKAQKQAKWKRQFNRRRR